MAQRTDRPYHHGNLRRSLLDAALAVIAEQGPHALSLRDVSTKTGVSHAAPAHHFTDKVGLLTAIAAEGYELLAEGLERARGDGGFLDVGLAYVRFAVDHPAHFQVMFQPLLYRPEDPAVQAARARTSAVLYGTATEVTGSGRPSDVALAGWCLMHGLATLWLAGNLPPLADDAVELARTIARTTFSGRRSGAPARPSAGARKPPD